MRPGNRRAGIGPAERAGLSETTGILWVVASGLLFGSQFVPRQFCARFPSAAYNVSMAFGILAGSLAALLLLGGSSIAPAMAGLAFLSGLIWVLGNYLFILAVARAGMARSFVVVGFSAVLSFGGGIVFLGELPGLGGSRLSLAVVAVGLVMLGSYLVTTTAPKREPSLAPAGPRVRQGLLAALAATLFFSAYNVVTAFVMNRAGTPAGLTFVAVAPGILCGAALLALLGRDRPLRAWRSAPARWHLLAALQGLIWATAMVCILFGWMGAGIALGTSVQVGTQTLVSSLWGVLAFGEFAGLENRRAAYLRLAGGALLTVAGIGGLASV